MKPKSSLKSALLIGLLTLVMSCNQDPCDVQHTIVNGDCIPDFIYPPNPNLKSGEQYYHKKFGIVTFKNGSWYDKNEHLIGELNAKYLFN